MPEIKVSQVTEIDNPELREIATRVVNIMQLAAEKATAHQAEPATYPISSDPNSFEQLFLSRFEQLPPEQQQAAIGKVLAAIKAPEAERVRVYGDLAKVDLRSATAVEAQTENLLLPDSLKFLQSETNSLSESRSQVLSRIEAGLTHKLELRIHKVKCFEETNEIGKDEISLGGNTVDESGNTENISAFKVGKFSSGKEVNYSPPRIFTTFDLLKYPGILGTRSYFATLVLAEIDWGGFPDFLNKLLEKVKQEVIKALTPLATALGTTIGAMIGSGIPILGTAIGAAIGAVVGWVVGKVFEWFKSWWDDEIFVPITLRADIPSLDARWNGKSESPQGEVSWKEHSGEYHLYYDWRIEVPLRESVSQQERYAAIWEQSSGPPFQARGGMTLDEYQATFNQLVGQGYRLVNVSGYSVNGQERYAAIWEQSSGPLQQVRGGMTPDEYQATFNQLVGQGYRLVNVSGYSVIKP